MADKILVTPPIDETEEAKRVFYEQICEWINNQGTEIDTIQETTETGPFSPTEAVGVSTAGGYGLVYVTWTAASYTGHSHTVVYRGTDSNPANAVEVGSSVTNGYTDVISSPDSTATYYYWVGHVARDDNVGDWNAAPATATLSTNVQYAIDVLFQKIGYEQFSTNNFPVRLESVLPTLPDADYPIGSVVFLTTDKKLYRNPDNIDWSTEVDSDDLAANSVIAGKIAAGAIVADDGVIANAAIKNAQINDVAADKITTGVITAEVTMITPELKNAASGETAILDMDGTDPYLKMTDASGNYVLMTKADLEFYQNNTLYKAVRRIETGSASTGSPVTFPNGAFNETPEVIVVPSDAPTYVNAQSAYDQSILIYPDDIDESGFTPIFVLVRSGTGQVTDSGAGVGGADLTFAQYTALEGTSATAQTSRTDVTAIQINWQAHFGWWEEYESGDQYDIGNVSFELSYRKKNSSDPWVFVSGYNDKIVVEANGVTGSTTISGLTAQDWEVKITLVDLYWGPGRPSYDFDVVCSITSLVCTTTGQPSIGSGDVRYWAIGD